MKINFVWEDVTPHAPVSVLQLFSPAVQPESGDVVRREQRVCDGGALIGGTRPDFFLPNDYRLYSRCCCYLRTWVGPSDPWNSDTDYVLVSLCERRVRSQKSCRLRGTVDQFSPMPSHHYYWRSQQR